MNLNFLGTYSYGTPLKISFFFIDGRQRYNNRVMIGALFHTPLRLTFSKHKHAAYQNVGNLSIQEKGYNCESKRKVLKVMAV